jgi:hypothetical protein
LLEITDESGGGVFDVLAEGSGCACLVAGDGEIGNGLVRRGLVAGGVVGELVRPVSV